MGWTSRQIANHKTAAGRLTDITRAVWGHLAKHPGISECEVERFVQKEFRRRGLAATGKFKTRIVAFNSHTASPHYFPPKRGSARLAPGTLVLLDIWARLKKPDSPFADITWMAYYGKKIPPAIQRAYDTVIMARDLCLAHLKREVRRSRMPTGKELDAVARDLIAQRGYEGKFIHGTGHPLGFTSPHGRGVKLNRRGRGAISKNIGYTIEPGVYLKGKFGIRSEMNFYVNSKNRVIVTTPMQKRIVRIK